MEKFIKDISAHWPMASAIIACLVSAAFWVFGMNATAAQTDTNTKEITGIHETVNRMDYNIQIMARRLGVKPLEPPK